jgi:imidazolonepropionase-like amidohydrolase
MITSALLFAALLSPEPVQGPVAIRVGRAETVSHGTIEHAVILVEDGQITVVGQDLPVERGIRVVDRPEWVAMPGLVNCQSRIGLDGRSSGGFEPHKRAAGEVWVDADEWEELLEAGVTTLGLVPDGKGTAGQAVAIRPHGETVEAMIVKDPAYLLMELKTDSSSKRTFLEGFQKADDYKEKEGKAREKWEKEQEKKKDKKKSKKDDDKDKKEEEKKEEKKEEEGDGADDVYTPPEVDPKVQPFLDLRTKTLSALIRIGRASDWLQLLSALGDEEFDWSLRVYLGDDVDVWYVAEAIGARKIRAVVEPDVTLRAHTRRELNIPRQLAEAGSPIAFVPTSDSLRGVESWLTDVALVVASGLDRQTALRALTLEPALVLGLGDRVGSLEAGKAANIVFLDGDPLDPGTEVVSVMLDGRFVAGEVNP